MEFTSEVTLFRSYYIIELGFIAGNQGIVIMGLFYVDSVSTVWSVLLGISVVGQNLNICRLFLY